MGHRFGELELELEVVVMGRVWSADDTIVVRRGYGGSLRGRKIACATVVTTVDHLRRTGWLVRRRVGLVG